MAWIPAMPPTAPCCTSNCRPPGCRINSTTGPRQDYMRDQAISGVINHTGSMHFDIRPASKWGTIEVRVSDASSNLRELSAIVALTHCLVVHFDRMVDA